MGGGFSLTCVTAMVHFLRSLFCANMRILAMIEFPDGL